MARKKGTLKLSSNIEPTVAAPLDAREVVDSIADLTAEGSFPYAYDGMRVSVKASHAIYMFKGGDTTDIDNWAKIGSDGEMDSYYTKSETDELLEDKVDAVEGKGLSTEDYTAAEKNKLSGITAGAEPNVQSDWTQSNNEADDYIKNKPTLGTAALKDVPVSGDASTTQVVTGDDSRLTDARTPVSHTHTLNDVTDAGTAASHDATNAVTQGSGDLVTSGAVWTAIDNLPEPLVYKGTLGAAADSPTITSLPTASEHNEGWTYLVITEGTYASKDARVGDKFSCALLDDGVTYQWIKFKAGDPDTDTWRNIKVNGTEKLGSAISTGGVDFVNGTNTTVSFDANGNKIKIDAKDTTYDPATQSADGLMSSTDKTKLDGIESGAQANAVTSVAGKTGAVSLEKSDVGLGNVPNVTTDNQTPTISEASTRANLASGDTLATIIGKIKKFFSDLKAVAFSGSYNDLTDKPTIPAAQVNSDWNASSGVAQILNKPSLATVATSGSYNDLSNKPTIPTVNNGTLTIQKNGTNVQTFTANQSGNATANITVPTKVSELTNDSGYTTNTGTVTQVKVGTTAYNPSSGVVSLPAYPTTLPASDVYSWAKASTKPSYTASEVGAAPSSGSLYYCKVVNSSNVTSTDNYAFNDLAKQHFAMAMINNATDNPQGAKKWCHAISMAWANNTNTSWVSQLAFGVEGSNGLWYRTTQGTVVGASWKRVIDSSNIGSQSVATATKLGTADKGSATNPIYLAAGVPTACTYSLNKTVPSNAVFTDTDTKNTAGTTNTTSKIYLAGATSQAANPQTYSNSSCYASGGHLYSNGVQVVNLSGSQALTNKTYNGYTLSTACAKGVVTSVLSGNANLVTSGGVYSFVTGRNYADTANIRVNAVKCGNVVVLSITCYAYTIASGGAIGGVRLDSDCRPSADRASGGVFCNSAGTGMIYEAITIKTDGYIRTGAAWSSLYGQITAIYAL